MWKSRDPEAVDELVVEDFVLTNAGEPVVGQPEPAMAGVRQFDDEQALGKALDVFAMRGFRNTSMLDLAAGTGVQRGSLYHAYGGKEEIFLKVFADHAATFLAGATRALDQPDKRRALLAFFDFCVDSITVGELSRGCLSTRTAIDATWTRPRVSAVVRAMLDELETVIGDAGPNPAVLRFRENCV